MEAGGYYKVGTYVLYDGDQYSDTQKFSINLQYDLNGKENYYTIATETAKDVYKRQILSFLHFLRQISSG